MTSSDHAGPAAPSLPPALGQGLHRAVGAAASSTIVTSTEGLVAGEVLILAPDRSIPAYQAHPSRRGPFPVVVVVHEVFGVHEHIKDVVRRLAKEGYLAVAPELSVRQGDVSRLSEFAEIRALVAKVPDAQVLADLDATVHWAEASGVGDPARLGLTGFCWGGRIAWLYAAHNPNLKTAVAWYGRLDGERTALQPRLPLDVVDQLGAPVLGLYGGADAGIPVAWVDATLKKLQQGPALSAAAQSEIVLYPDAPHAFFADYRPSFRQKAAEDGWQRLLAWLHGHGVS